MSKFCAVKMKYYKHSNASGELGHVARYKNGKNKNVLPMEHIRYKNFGTKNLYKKYQDSISRAEEDKGRKFQKNANTFVDAVIVLSEDQVNALINRYSYKPFAYKIDEAVKNWQNEVKEELGLEPIGYRAHMDEGHVSEGKVSYNYHIHVIFLNYDFDKRESPLRKFKKDIFSFLQDLIYKSFKELGFERGVKKSITKKKGLTKDEYVKKKESSLEDSQRLESTISFSKSGIIYNLSEEDEKYCDKIRDKLSESGKPSGWQDRVHQNVNKLRK